MGIALEIQSFTLVTVEISEALMENFCCGLIVYLGFVEVRELEQCPWSNSIW